MHEEKDRGAALVTEMLFTQRLQARQECDSIFGCVGGTRGGRRLECAALSSAQVRKQPIISSLLATAFDGSSRLKYRMQVLGTSALASFSENEAPSIFSHSPCSKLEVRLLPYFFFFLALARETLKLRHSAPISSLSPTNVPAL